MCYNATTEIRGLEAARTICGRNKKYRYIHILHSELYLTFRHAHYLLKHYLCFLSVLYSSAAKPRSLRTKERTISMM